MTSRLAATGTLVLAASLWALGPIPATAGEGHHCPEPLDHCVRVMASKLGERGWVGIEMDREEGQPYLVVTRVIPESPAAVAGVKAGDVLVELNGIPYLQENQEKVEVVYRQEMTVGNTITYTVEREGARRKLRIHLVAIPESVRAQWIGHHVLHYHGLSGKDEKVAEKP
jgi:predicted metalloprotease with PDZ domain